MNDNPKNYLSDDEIQTILKRLENGDKYSSRGRIGVGLEYKNGKYLYYNFEDFSEEVVSEMDKEQFIQFLKRIDIENDFFGYWRQLRNP
ncbi:MAG: hypothetical protein NZ108_09700 [Bacteroidia bacterium]|nr:hypothetical protein [Bacteroidia bacterium]